MIKTISDKYVGNVGLMITEMIPIAGKILYGMWQSAELENQMTSVEWILEYTNRPQEAELKSFTSILINI